MALRGGLPLPPSSSLPRLRISTQRFASPSPSPSLPSRHFSLSACRTPLTFRSRVALSLRQAQSEGHSSVKLDSHSTESMLQPEVTKEDDECELVNGCDISLGEGDESLDGYLVTALKNNNKTALLLLSDVYGYKDQENRDFAYRLACFGFNVLVPDLFEGAPWGKGRPQEEYEEWRASHPPQEIARRVDMSVNWLNKELGLGNLSKVGVLGFCFGGGRLMEALANDSLGIFQSAVCFYGTRFDASLAAKIRVPLLFIVGDRDPLCPLELVQKVDSLAAFSQVRVYKGRGHAFAHRPESLEEDEDAEDAFRAARNWLSEHLVSRPE